MEKQAVQQNRWYFFWLIMIVLFVFFPRSSVQAFIVQQVVPTTPCACVNTDGTATCSPPVDAFDASITFPIETNESQSETAKSYAIAAESLCKTLSNATRICVFIPQINAYNPPDDPLTSEQITQWCELSALPIRTNMCAKITSEAECKKIYGCYFVDNTCQVGESLTGAQKKQLTTEELNTFLTSRYAKPEGYTGPLPDCAFSGTCSDVNDLVQLAINVAKWLFGFLGMFALVMFVYGGFVWILSGGSPERVKHGRDILIAAIIGIIIAFGAYVLINFLLDALSVTSDFRFKIQ